jgi:hypothetical protein
LITLITSSSLTSLFPFLLEFQLTDYFNALKSCINGENQVIFIHYHSNYYYQLTKPRPPFVYLHVYLQDLPDISADDARYKGIEFEDYLIVLFLGCIFLIGLISIVIKVNMISDKTDERNSRYGNSNYGDSGRRDVTSTLLTSPRDHVQTGPAVRYKWNPRSLLSRIWGTVRRLHPSSSTLNAADAVTSVVNNHLKSDDDLLHEDGNQQEMVHLMKKYDELESQTL